MATYEFFVLIIVGISVLELSLVDGESHICGYNNDDSVACCTGYTKDSQGECTIPVCEGDCGSGGQCIRPETCYCSDGTVSYACHQDQRSDTRIASSPTCIDNCNGQGICVKGTCQCHLGYSGTSCLEKPVNQCYLSLTRGICQKLNSEIKINVELCCGAFDVAWGEPCQKCPKSRCGKGFLEIDGICKDVNECTIPGICASGQCDNLDGSYRCICSLGSQFDPRQGDCVKVQDMCKRIPSVCGPGMMCMTLPMQRYSCQCKQGYIKSPDQKSCVLKPLISFDFCAIYGKMVCQFGQCVPDGRNYKCNCNPGYSSSSDQKSCRKDVDFCAIYSNTLCQNGLCVSLSNDYMCKCDPGYTVSFDGKKCTSICDSYGASLCPNARCIPRSGGDYQCRCYDGFAAFGKGKQCRRIMNDDQSVSSSQVVSVKEKKDSNDIDYCSYNYYRSQCQGGQCINHQNYYQCHCLPGFMTEKNGLSCKKIDEEDSTQMRDGASMEELRNYCDKYGSFVCTNGRCVESGSSWQCQCNSGYKESNDKKSCHDVNECSADPNICIQGTCINSPGSYQCSCKDGFTIHYLPGGPKCYDRNECEEDKYLCGNGRCINQWGSYSCSCNVGFVPSGNGKHCLPALSHLERKNSWNSTKCKDCLSSCKVTNTTHHQCECPSGVAPVLNTGLCAPLSLVVDIEFDIVLTNSAKKPNQSEDNIKVIFFKLNSGVNKHSFIALMTTQFRSVVIDKCVPISDPDRDGIRCYFYKKSLD